LGATAVRCRCNGGSLMPAFNAPQIVGLWLVANLVAVGLYDVLASYAGGQEATVTAVIRQWSVSHPALPFLAGVLIGHLFAW